MDFYFFHLMPWPHLPALEQPDALYALIHDFSQSAAPVAARAVAGASR
ncbi:MAG TPA: hypothetical protein VN812_08745 [Candidatus Acidoferrales bacterium]|nr:hypothetical protein [Candidatus Acidoferrales bacterium]